MGAQLETTPAVVCRGAGLWEVEDVQVDTNLQPREVLVEVTASGLCHTDLLFASMASAESGSILGHEG
jgi:aryl-alcohol dehydrogenase